jgi:hypothetical protein
MFSRFAPIGSAPESSHASPALAHPDLVWALSGGPLAALLEGRCCWPALRMTDFHWHSTPARSDLRQGVSARCAVRTVRTVRCWHHGGTVARRPQWPRNSRRAHERRRARRAGWPAAARQPHRDATHTSSSLRRLRPARRRRPVLPRCPPARDSPLGRVAARRPAPGTPAASESRRRGTAPLGEPQGGPI